MEEPPTKKPKVEDEDVSSREANKKLVSLKHSVAQILNFQVSTIKLHELKAVCLLVALH